MEFKKTTIAINLYGEKITLCKPTIKSQMAFEEEVAEANSKGSGKFIEIAEKHLISLGFPGELFQTIESEHFIAVVEAVFSTVKKK